MGALALGLAALGSLVLAVLTPPQDALAAPGARAWIARYNGPGNSRDNASALAISPDGSQVFVTGASYGSTSQSDYATVAYDAASGARLWAKRYNGPGNSYDDANALRVSPDGTRVFVSGGSIGSTGYDYATVAYDAASGARLWVKRYSGPGSGPANDWDVAFAIGVSPDGSKLFVTGYSYGSTRDPDYATVAYDASSGARLWVRRYAGPGTDLDNATALGVSPDGSKVFVTGRSFGGSTSGDDYATLAYDAASGARLWVRRYDGPGFSIDDYATALGVSPDGSKVFVTGLIGSANHDYATLAYDASSGARLWMRRYNGRGNAQDHATALAVSPDGSKVVVTGQSDGPNSSDYATLAYDASSGARLWGKRYDGPGNASDAASALGVSPDGSEVFVTGFRTQPTGRRHYATLAYDASSGARLWLSAYNGPGKGDDVAAALGVSPDGSSVFVTGESTGSTTFLDYATVAYDTR